MKHIINGLRAEYIKIHRTPVYWLLLLCPLALNILMFLLINEVGEKWVKGGANPWKILYGFNYQALADFFIVLFVAMMTSLINNVEHKGTAWKHLYALAQPRWAVYVNKSIYSLMLLFTALLFFALMQVFAGNVLALTRPDLGFQTSALSLNFNLVYMFKTFFTIFAVWSIHQWLTFRFRNFALSIGIGLIMLIFTTIALEGIKWAKYLPYAYVKQIFAKTSQTIPSVFGQEVWLGIGVGLLIWLGGLWDALRKDVL